MKTIAAPKQRRDDVIDINSGIKPGDIVSLKTGGPKMVVMRIVVHGQHKDREAECCGLWVFKVGEAYATNVTSHGERCSRCLDW